METAELIKKSLPGDLACEEPDPILREEEDR
jgi:hypothetical protein